jgi:LuxR family transcriptional regulator, maltose regulon positive regulatory protein
LTGQIGRPYLEFTGLAFQATLEIVRSYPRAAEHCRRAIALAERHGWTDEPAACTAYMTLGAVLTNQGKLEEAEPWIQRAERTVRAEAQPVAGMGVYTHRAAFELARGRNAEARAAFSTAERLAGLLAAPNPLITGLRAFRLQTQVRAGETEDAEQAVAGLGEQERDRGEMRITIAMIRLAQDDPHGAIAALGPVLDGSAPLAWPPWLVHAFLLEAIAQEALGDRGAADRALERALNIAEPDGALLPFLLYPAPDLLQRHVGLRTSHAALIAEILDLLAGKMPAPSGGPQPPLTPLSESEIRVLRYLPTNLSTPEIANQLHVSRNTVRTHMSHLYAKLGTHRRTESVERARALGLLAPLGPRR